MTITMGGYDSDRMHVVSIPKR